MVRRFVAAGGSLFTTDWALRHVLEPAFPGVVAYNQRPTADAVVRVEAAAHENPFLKGVMDGADDPIWWLEGSSYPIVVRDPARVKVLISSRELQERWGEAPVALTFRAGEGEVFHMISHYYLQRAETRTRRHRMPAAAYAAEKGVAWDPPTMACAADLTLGEVEAASSSARLFANVVGEKKRRMMEEHARRRARENAGPGAPRAAGRICHRQARWWRQGGRMNPADTVVTLLTSGLRLGEAQESGPLTLVPLFHEGEAATYRLFAAALAEGLVTVRSSMAGRCRSSWWSTTVPKRCSSWRGRCWAGFARRAR